MPVSFLAPRRQGDNSYQNRALTRFIDEVEKGRNKFMVILSVQTDQERSLPPAMSSIIHAPVVVLHGPILSNGAEYFRSIEIFYLAQTIFLEHVQSLPCVC